ncbi:sugar ABC transporter substrate-binding protein [Haloterrigena sp. SYSU A121-1]|uniref:Sugar ABC transporter substrate-binding protein n=1 Tax=Haloterrigena gelatinilytica TaxID=2741724 RepID=A0A8J8GIS0_9EURY|nr:sugar ABC transporter substrate-binding protein [Haloterrigena gelatinilytica]NUB90123.1 sugar ABC transporter substrate-binding protein [Haloterrigena gelatinilytica]
MSTEQTDAEAFEDIDPDPDAVLAEFGVDSPEELVADGGAHDPTTDDEISEALRASSSRTQSDDDVDDTTAAELFADLEGQAAEARALEERDDGVTDAPGESTDEESPPEFEEFEAAFVGTPSVTSREDEGLVESTAAELNAVAERVFGSDETSADDAGDAPLESGVITEAEAPTDADESAEGNAGDGGPVTDARRDDSSPDRTLTVSRATNGLELVGPEPTTTRVESDVFGCAGADEC